MNQPCSCIYVDNYDQPEFIYEETRKARKEHNCCECGRIISRGEKYEHTTGKWDRIDTFKTCIDCLSIRNAFFCAGWGYTMIQSDLWEHLLEMNGDISGDCIAELTPGARDMVCDMIEEIWEQKE